MLPTHVRMAPVEVRLAHREEMQVPLARRPIGIGRAGPGGAREVAAPARGHDRAVRALARMEPEPGALGGARPRRQCRLEPPVLVGDVVRDDVDDGPDAHPEGLRDERLGLREGPEPRVDGTVVGDVVAAIRERGDVPRGDPDGIDAQVAQIAQARPDACDVADAVAVRVGEAARVDLVDDRVSPPARVIVRRRHGRIGGCRRRACRDGREGCGRDRQAGGGFHHDAPSSMTRPLPIGNLAGSLMERTISDNYNARTQQANAGALRGRTYEAGLTGPVEPRTTSSGRKRSSSRGTLRPSIWAMSSSMTMRPMASMGCRTVVSGGSVQFMSAESS